MLALARSHSPVSFPRMSGIEDTEEQVERRLRARALRIIRKRADLTQEQAALKAEVQTGSWRRYEAGDRDLNLDKIGTLVGALGYSLQDFLNVRDELARGKSPTVRSPGRASGQVVPLFQPHGVLLPIRDRVQAGAWLAADDLNQGQVRTYPAARDPRYPYADQWLSEVVGDSVDKLGIYDGDYVQLVSVIDINYQPKTGDVVEVERLRFGGQERELTLKQLEVTSSGLRLWPRSSNTRYQEPLEINDGVAEAEEFEVRLRGLLVAAIRRF